MTSSRRKFYGRHHDLVKPYYGGLSGICHRLQWIYPVCDMHNPIIRSLLMTYLIIGFLRCVARPVSLMGLHVFFRSDHLSSSTSFNKFNGVRVVKPLVFCASYIKKLIARTGQERNDKGDDFHSPIVNFPFIYLATFQQYLHIYGKAEYYKKNRIKKREMVGTSATDLPPPPQMCTCFMLCRWTRMWWNKLLELSKKVVVQIHNCVPLVPPPATTSLIILWWKKIRCDKNRFCCMLHHTMDVTRFVHFYLFKIKIKITV